MKFGILILVFGVLVAFHSCQKSDKTVEIETPILQDTISAISTSKKQIEEEKRKINDTDSLEIVKSLGYELGFDKGFDDAGSALYDDDPGETCQIGRYRNEFLGSFKQGYEDGWIEWKNRNNDFDY